MLCAIFCRLFAMRAFAMGPSSLCRHLTNVIGNLSNTIYHSPCQPFALPSVVTAFLRLTHKLTQQQRSTQFMHDNSAWSFSVAPCITASRAIPLVKLVKCDDAKL
ncbi:hypothetical protein EDB83DRAFT_2331176 [Lactarius deliciosus]|nr:hypothetical protein EDB83DRAFT_2331176 [Lactarius deliciosus]